MAALNFALCVLNSLIKNGLTELHIHDLVPRELCSRRLTACRAGLAHPETKEAKSIHQGKSCSIEGKEKNSIL